MHNIRSVRLHKHTFIRGQSLRRKASIYAVYWRALYLYLVDFHSTGIYKSQDLDRRRRKIKREGNQNLEKMWKQNSPLVEIMENH